MGKGRYVAIGVAVLFGVIFLLLQRQDKARLAEIESFAAFIGPDKLIRWANAMVLTHPPVKKHWAVAVRKDEFPESFDAFTDFEDGEIASASVHDDYEGDYVSVALYVRQGNSLRLLVIESDVRKNDYQPGEAGKLSSNPHPLQERLWTRKLR